MEILEGTHRQGGSGRRIGYHVAYEVVAHVVRFQARFDVGTTHEGQFDFDPSKVDAVAAVDAFMRNHIERADWDVTP